MEEAEWDILWFPSWWSRRGWKQLTMSWFCCKFLVEVPLQRHNCSFSVVPVRRGKQQAHMVLQEGHYLMGWTQVHANMQHPNHNLLCVKQWSRLLSRGHLLPTKYGFAANTKWTKSTFALPSIFPRFGYSFWKLMHRAECNWKHICAVVFCHALCVLGNLRSCWANAFIGGGSFKIKSGNRLKEGSDAKYLAYCIPSDKSRPLQSTETYYIWRKRKNVVAKEMA